MPKTVELTCSKCGGRFTMEVDMLIEGVSGFINTRETGFIKIVDPTRPFECPDCFKGTMAAIGYNLTTDRRYDLLGLKGE